MAHSQGDASKGSPASGLFSKLFNWENTSAQVLGPRLLVLVSAAALFLLGVVMIYSASSIEAISEGNDPWYYMGKQLAFAVVATAGLLVARFVPYEKWRGGLGIVAYLAALALLAAVAVIGTAALGAQRWLLIGGFTLQPSELAKIAFMVIAARLMAEYNEGSFSVRQFYARLFIFVVVPLGILYKTQSDLGTTFICIVGILVILWIGRVPLWHIVVILGAIAGFLAFAAFAGYRSDRWVYLNPWPHYYDSGFQVIHSWFAFAQGGLFGKGLGNSAEKYLYLPEAETDFIFSIIGEELGLIVACLVVIAFVAFLVGSLRISQNASSQFGALLAASLGVMLVFQAFLNMGMCVGVMPTTGKPLPFISSGGSSLLSSFIIVGLILAVSAGTDDRAYDRKRRDFRLLHAVKGEGEDRRGGRLELGSDAGYGNFDRNRSSERIETPDRTDGRRMSRRAERSYDNEQARRPRGSRYDGSRPGRSGRRK